VLKKLNSLSKEKGAELCSLAPCPIKQPTSVRSQAVVFNLELTYELIVNMVWQVIGILLASRQTNRSIVQGAFPKWISEYNQRVEH
jgi:hypothetical protein